MAYISDRAVSPNTRRGRVEGKKPSAPSEELHILFSDRKKKKGKT